MRHVLLPLLALFAATAASAQITGSTTQVTSFAGAQFDPSIDGDLVVYTEDTGGTTGTDVRYVDLTTDVTNAANHVFVAGSAGDQRLHDVSGDVIVYTDASGPAQEVYRYDVSTGTATQLAVSASDPSVDDQIVAYEALNQTGGAPDVGIADLTTNTTTVITTTTDWETLPVVGGGYVVFERAPTAFGMKHVILKDLVTGTETDLGPGTEPHTDGKTVVFSALNVLDDDVYVFTIGGAAAPQPIVLPGNQRSPHVDGDYIAFDDDSGTNQDVVILRLSTGDSLAVAGGTLAIEFLNDLDGNRVAFTKVDLSTGDLDIFVFEIDQDPQPPGDTTDDPCADQTGLTLEESFSFTRERGAPTTYSETFNTSLDEAVIVVRNERCASALVHLNGELVVRPNQLSVEATCGYGVIALEASNTLDVELRSAPGCELSVDVYSVDDPAATAPGCSQSSATGTVPFAWLALLLLGLARRRR